MAECEHDWRVNPFIVLPSSPPQYELVCAACGMKRPSGIRTTRLQRLPSRDPRDWEKWRD